MFLSISEDQALNDLELRGKLCHFNKQSIITPYFVLFAGRHLDKDILKQLFIATVTETEKRWTTHFKEDQVCP